MYLKSALVVCKLICGVFFDSTQLTVTMPVQSLLVNYGSFALESECSFYWPFGGLRGLLDDLGVVGESD